MTNTEETPVIKVDDFPFTNLYNYEHFPTLEQLYKYDKHVPTKPNRSNIIIFSIDGADWVEYGENKDNPTDKAKLANKRFLHHFLQEYDSDDIAILTGCYDGRKEFSYAVESKHFYEFVKELGYVNEQHSYLVLEVLNNFHGVFGWNRTPEIELIETCSGSIILKYSRIEKIEECFLKSALGWTYCNKSETYYELV
jgi:hypothetical protein